MDKLERIRYEAGEKLQSVLYLLNDLSNGITLDKETGGIAVGNIDKYMEALDGVDIFRDEAANKLQRSHTLFKMVLDGKAVDQEMAKKALLEVAKYMEILDLHKKPWIK